MAKHAALNLKAAPDAPTGPARPVALRPLKTGVVLLLCTALLSGCVARTAVKTTAKATKTVVKTTGKVAGAVVCTATDVVVRDPRCKG